MASLKHNALTLANRVLQPFDLRLTRRSEILAFLGRNAAGKEEYQTVPPESVRYLRGDNPRLLELRRRYSGHPAAVHSKWTPEFVRESVNLPLFRRDNAYVYQTRQGLAEPMYLLTAAYARSVDSLRLFARFQEDGAFGAYVVEDDGGKKVSRDLIDSVIEINYLDAVVGLSRKTDAVVLDIGAGYGRLATRLVEGLDNVRGMFCADAVPESTYLSEFYLRFRGLAGRAEVLVLDEVEARLAGRRIDIATNVHSFSECSLASITWWLNLLARLGVRYFFLVPNTGRQLLSTERPPDSTGRMSRLDFLPVIESAGYRLVDRRPKFSEGSALQRWGLFPTEYHLFELR